MSTLKTKRHYFVTGTDTDVGKTYICRTLLEKAMLAGHQCFGIKPVTAGCTLDANNNYISDDANQLAQVSSVQLHSSYLAPIKLTTACSPHIAAAIDGQNLLASRITGLLRGALSTPASHVLIEGAGGWLTPLNGQETLADVASQLGLPVLLVVDIKLGCLNHALLTAQAIQQSGLTLAGWIANETHENTPFFTEQVNTLVNKIPAKNLGIVKYGGIELKPLVWF